MPVEERDLTSDASSEGTTGREIGLGLINPLTPKRSRSDFTAGRRLMIVCPSVKPVGEPDAGNPSVRFDQREVETEHGMRLLSHTPLPQKQTGQGAEVQCGRSSAGDVMAMYWPHCLTVIADVSDLLAVLRTTG